MTGPSDDEPSAWHALGPMMDLVTPMAVRVAATLGLADHLDDTPVPVGELADRTATDPDALSRLLRHLTARGMFVEPSPGTFAANGLATLLRRDHPSGMHRWLSLDEFGGQMDLAFTGLLDTVRSGNPAWESLFGAPFWHYLDAHPTMAASFDATMASGTDYLADAASGCDWTRTQHVVDVGGGTGALLAEILSAHPDLRATLVDLPDTVARAQAFLASLGLDRRCALVGQSFFDALPTHGDAYVLSGVLHDWADEDAIAILRRCADVAGERGRVIIIEGHGTSGDDPTAFAEMNLRMLVLCGGRERDLDAFATLTAAAGLRITQTHTTPLGHTVLDCAPRPTAT